MERWSRRLPPDATKPGGLARLFLLWNWDRVDLFISPTQNVNFCKLRQLLLKLFKSLTVTADDQDRFVTSPAPDSLIQRAGQG